MFTAIDLPKAPKDPYLVCFFRELFELVQMNPQARCAAKVYTCAMEPVWVFLGSTGRMDRV